MTQYQTADLTVDAELRTVQRGSKSLTLSPLTFDLLLALIQRAPAVSNTDDLLSDVWTDQVVGPETLTQRIAILRKQLADGNASMGYIESIRSRGYRWMPAVSLVDAGETNNVQQRSWRLPVAAVLIGGLLAAFAYSKFVATPSQGQEGISTTVSLNAEKLTQAWRYYDQFDAKSNGLARQLFADVLTHSPQSVSALVGLSATFSQEVTKFNGSQSSLDQAQAYANQAVSLDADSAEAYWALGYAYDAAGDLTEAIEAYSTSAELDPDNARVAGSLAYLLAIEGELAEALKTSLMVLDSDAHYRYLQLANTLRLLQFSGLAEHWYAVADELNPDSVFAAKSRAEFLFVRGRLQQADQLAEDAIARGVQRPELLLIRSMLAWDAGEQQQAVELLSAAQREYPDRLDLSIWQAWYTAQLQGELDQTLENPIADAMTDNPVWPAVWVDMAIFEMARQDADAAISALQRAVDLGYRDLDLLQRLAPFRSLHETAQFQSLLAITQALVDQERQAVIRAAWLPDSFLDIANTIVD